MGRVNAAVAPVSFPRWTKPSVLQMSKGSAPLLTPARDWVTRSFGIRSKRFFVDAQGTFDPGASPGRNAAVALHLDRPPRFDHGNNPQAPNPTWEVFAPSSINLLAPARVLLAWIYVEFEPPVPSTVSCAPAGGPARSAR